MELCGEMNDRYCGLGRMDGAGLSKLELTEEERGSRFKVYRRGPVRIA